MLLHGYAPTDLLKLNLLKYIYRRIASIFNCILKFYTNATLFLYVENLSGSDMQFGYKMLIQQQCIH